MRKLVLCLLLCPVVFSCASFPVPSSDEDALIIFPVSYTEEKVVSTFGYVNVFLENDAGSYKKTVSLYASYKYKEAIVKAGKIRIVGMQFVYKDSTQKSEFQPLNIAFEIKPGQAVIFPATLVFHFWQEGNSYWIRKEWAGLTEIKKKAVFESLQKENNFVMWEYID